MGQTDEQADGHRTVHAVYYASNVNILLFILIVNCSDKQAYLLICVVLCFCEFCENAVND